MRRMLLLYSSVAVLSGCGQISRQTEDYRLTSISELTLTPTTHPHGYGRQQCFVCHNPNNIHQVDRLGAPNFDIAKKLVDQSGLNSCMGCHGNNGVSQ